MLPLRHTRLTIHVAQLLEGSPKPWFVTRQLVSCCDSHNRQHMDLVFSAETGGFASADIRKTNEVPPRVSLFDLIKAVKNIERNNARTDLQNIRNTHPELVAACGYHKFPGRGQRDTPVADWPTALRILGIMLVRLVAGGSWAINPPQ